MGVIIEPGVQESQSIAVETRRKTPIDNAQCFEVSPFERSLANDLRRKYDGHVHYRTGLSPIYNCHGLTFASRRTVIDEDASVARILDEDAYCEVPVGDVLPGDIVVYWTETGEVDHSGVVVSKPDPTFGSFPEICSKWGKFFEVVHRANQCPYELGKVKYYRVVR